MPGSVVEIVSARPLAGRRSLAASIMFVVPSARLSTKLWS